MKNTAEKLKKGLLECLQNSPFIRQRMKYFLQVNELYREEQKLRVNDSNVVGENQKFNIVLKSLKKEK